MKKTLFIIGLLMCLSIFTANSQSHNYRLAQNDYEQIKLNYEFSISDVQNTIMKDGTDLYTRLSIAECTPGGEVGKPELPVMSKLIEIPLCDSIIVEVSNSQYVIHDAASLGIDHQLYPLQPAHSKSEDGPFALVKDLNAYSQDGFYSLPVANAEIIGVMRNINLATLYISPIAYNPVTNQIKLYTHFDVTVSFVNARIPETIQLKSLHSNGLFDNELSCLLNPMFTQNRDELNVSPVKYLIIAHSMFKGNEQLNEFITWKKRIGYIVETAYTDDSYVGTTSTSIREYIKNQYLNATAENPAPSFLLLIGDVAQIPAFNSQGEYGLNDHVTDLYYACWSAGDHIPDCYYGRFSAQNISQLIPQIEKTLMYEQYTMPDKSYLNKAVLVAGTDSYYGTSHANGQINYLASNYVNPDHGFSTVYKHLYNCSSQASTIRSEIGAGVGYANYTAHCSSSGWGDPSFTTSHISAMSNADKYGFMIGNCCQSGRFNDNQCFGEGLLRAANKGAVAYIGCSNNSYWDQDFYWSVGVRSTIGTTSYNALHLGAYDRIFHTHNEAHSDWYVTAGGMVRAGNLSVESSNSAAAYKLYYWEIYHLFGDPSLKPYLSQPDEMNLNIPNTVPISTSSLDLTVVPYAYVALTLNGSLVTAAFADATGNVVLPIPSNILPDNYELAVSAQHYVQYFQTIAFVVPSGSYVISNIDYDSEQAVISNNVTFDLSCKNIGIEAAGNVRVEITSMDNKIGFGTTSATVGSINANEQKSVSHAFSAQIAHTVTDQSVARVRVTTFYDNDFNENIINLVINAPEIKLENYTMSETSGNNNGILEPGESGVITMTVHNTGHAKITDLLTSLISYSSLISISNNTPTIASLDADGIEQVSFNISLASQAVIGNRYDLQFSCYNELRQIYEPVSITIGGSMEDFESNSFNSFNWQNGDNPWYITTENAYAGQYSARSKNNLSNYGVSALQISMNVIETSTISYFRKVSSESSYDFFNFKIDGSEEESLSGDVEWGMFSKEVTPGTHVFTFEYQKDMSQSHGSDCAWIDNIIFPKTGPVQVPDIPELTIDGYRLGGVLSNIIYDNNQVDVIFKFSNIGSTSANNVAAQLSTGNSNININNNGTSAQESHSYMAAHSSDSSTYHIGLNSQFTGWTNVDFLFTLTDGHSSLVCPLTLIFGTGNSPVSVENNTKSVIVFYPNPASDKLTIESTENMQSIEVIDMNGKRINFISNIGDSKYSLNVSSLATGLYFVKIVDGNQQVITHKFIKK